MFEVHLSSRQASRRRYLPRLSLTVVFKFDTFDIPNRKVKEIRFILNCLCWKRYSCGLCFLCSSFTESDLGWISGSRSALHSLTRRLNYKFISIFTARAARSLSLRYRQQLEISFNSSRFEDMNMLSPLRFILNCYRIVDTCIHYE